MIEWEVLDQSGFCNIWQWLRKIPLDIVIVQKEIVVYNSVMEQIFAMYASDVWCITSDCLVLHSTYLNISWQTNRTDPGSNLTPNISLGYKARSIVTGPTRPSSLEAGSYTGYQAQLNIKVLPGRACSMQQIPKRMKVDGCNKSNSCTAPSSTVVDWLWYKRRIVLYFLSLVHNSGTHSISIPKIHPLLFLLFLLTLSITLSVRHRAIIEIHYYYSEDNLQS